MPTSYNDAILGSTILVYLDKDNGLVKRVTDKIISAHVVSVYEYPGFKAVCLGWRAAEARPLITEYTTPKFWARWDRNNANRYKFSDDIDLCVAGSWIRHVDVNPDRNLFAGIYDNVFGDGAIIPGTVSKILYIKATEIMPGDVVAWITSNHTLNYAFVRDSTESESVTEEPIVVLDAEVYCNEGQRKFPNGYPMPCDEQVLLISRENPT